MARREDLAYGKASAVKYGRLFVVVGCENGKDAWRLRQRALLVDSVDRLFEALVLAREDGTWEAEIERDWMPVGPIAPDILTDGWVDPFDAMEWCASWAYAPEVGQGRASIAAPKRTRLVSVTDAADAVPSCVFELVKETREQVVVKVNAKSPLTVAFHPYVNAQMAYITVTRGKENTYTIINHDGSTRSWHLNGMRSPCLDSNDRRLVVELNRWFESDLHLILGAKTELNPYLAEFYLHDGRWFVDFSFCDTDKKARVYFEIGLYPTPEVLVDRAFSGFNALFKGQAPVVYIPDSTTVVGDIYRVEIRDDWG